MKKTLIVFFALFVCAGLFATNYFVGDIGPRGGIIFYSSYIYGKERTLKVFYEAAPASVDFRAAWGSPDHFLNVPWPSEYDGRSITRQIIELTEQKAGRSKLIDYAAFRCYELRLNGTNDWYMPAQWEMEEMYNALKRSGILDKDKDKNRQYGFKNDIYWCSDEAGEREPYLARVVSMVNGRNTTFRKNSQFWVRPVRRFIETDW